MIDELDEDFGYSRKHAIKLLNAKAGWGGPDGRGRCGKKPGTLLKNKLPIRTDNWASIALVFWRRTRWRTAGRAGKKILSGV